MISSVLNILQRFLLARFHMDMLADAITVREVRITLRNLPKDTGSMYDETMKRVEGQTENCKTLAKHVLSWIIYAYRPLTLNELQHAIAVSSDSMMTKLEPDALVDEKILTSVCAGLIVVDAERRIVRLVRKGFTFTCKSVLDFLSQTTLHRNIFKRKGQLFFRMQTPAS